MVSMMERFIYAREHRLICSSWAQWIRERWKRNINENDVDSRNDIIRHHNNKQNLYESFNIWMRKGIIPHVWALWTLTPVIVCDFTNWMNREKEPRHIFMITNDPHTHILCSAWSFNVLILSFLSSTWVACSLRTICRLVAWHHIWMWRRWKIWHARTLSSHWHVFLIYAKSIATDACEWGLLSSNKHFKNDEQNGSEHFCFVSLLFKSQRDNNHQINRIFVRNNTYSVPPRWEQSNVH